MALRSFLHNVDIFSGLPEDVLDLVIERGSEQHVPAGRVLVEQGQSGGGLHLLLNGSALVRSGGTDIATLGSGDYFGEMSQTMLDLAPECAGVQVKILTRRVRRLEEALRR